VKRLTTWLLRPPLILSKDRTRSILFDALDKTALFPKMAMPMIKMGERTGHLEEICLHLANIYSKQLRISIPYACVTRADI
jgi:hypothetical protein